MCLPNILLFFTAAHFHLAGRSSSFSVIHVSVHVKKKLRKIHHFFLSKSPGGHVISFQIKP